mmetsp:Transcript_138494/g.196022  ORF Transcript_138494/g.196022 Transcript_138494/m.196022 type:complete len:199 (+) Transcript_138494:166-762(+)
MGDKGTDVRPEFKFKIIFLGDVDVGKTSLILRFSQDRFEEKTDMLGDLDDESRILEADGRTCKMILTDTGGREGFSTLTSSYYRNADAIVLVYDITREDTYEHVMDHFKEADRYSPHSQKFLVGNKSDLEEERKIDQEKCKVMAENLGVQSFETSAKDDQGVGDMFVDIATRLAVEAGAQLPPELPASKKGKKGCILC